VIFNGEFVIFGIFFGEFVILNGEFVILNGEFVILNGEFVILSQILRAWNARQYCVERTLTISLKVSLKRVLKRILKGKKNFFRMIFDYFYSGEGEKTFSSSKKRKLRPAIFTFFN
jgi:hypothetical protein